MAINEKAIFFKDELGNEQQLDRELYKENIVDLKTRTETYYTYYVVSSILNDSKKGIIRIKDNNFLEQEAKEFILPPTFRAFSDATYPYVITTNLFTNEQGLYNFITRKFTIGESYDKIAIEEDKRENNLQHNYTVLAKRSPHKGAFHLLFNCPKDLPNTQSIEVLQSLIPLKFDEITRTTVTSDFNKDSAPQNEIFYISKKGQMGACCYLFEKDSEKSVIIPIQWDELYPNYRTFNVLTNKCQISFSEESFSLWSLNFVVKKDGNYGIHSFKTGKDIVPICFDRAIYRIKSTNDYYATKDDVPFLIKNGQIYQVKGNGKDDNSDENSIQNILKCAKEKELIKHKFTLN